jgi:hypothetical protein
MEKKMGWSWVIVRQAVHQHQQLAATCKARVRAALLGHVRGHPGSEIPSRITPSGAPSFDSFSALFKRANGHKSRIEKSLSVFHPKRPGAQPTSQFLRSKRAAF